MIWEYITCVLLHQLFFCQNFQQNQNFRLLSKNFLRIAAEMSDLFSLVFHALLVLVYEIEVKSINSPCLAFVLFSFWPFVRCYFRFNIHKFLFAHSSIQFILCFISFFVRKMNQKGRKWNFVLVLISCFLLLYFRGNKRVQELFQSSCSISFRVVVVTWNFRIIIHV